MTSFTRIGDSTALSYGSNQAIKSTNNSVLVRTLNAAMFRVRIAGNTRESQELHIFFRYRHWGLIIVSYASFRV